MNSCESHQVSAQCSRRCEHTAASRSCHETAGSARSNYAMSGRHDRHPQCAVCRLISDCTADRVCSCCHCFPLFQLSLTLFARCRSTRSRVGRQYTRASTLTAATTRTPLGLDCSLFLISSHWYSFLFSLHAAHVSVCLPLDPIRSHPIVCCQAKFLPTGSRCLPLLRLLPLRRRPRSDRATTNRQPQPRTSTDERGAEGHTRNICLLCNNTHPHIITSFHFQTVDLDCQRAKCTCTCSWRLQRCLLLHPRPPDLAESDA